MTIGAAVVVAGILAPVGAYADSQHQVPDAGFSAFPQSPSPAGSFDWHQRAIDYDSYVYNWADRGPYTTISTDTDHLNMSTDSYKMPSYLGDERVDDAPGMQEAVNEIASVVGASLVGIDKSNQDGHDYVDMLRTFYHPDLGVALNSPSTSSSAPGSGSIWYTTTANLLYFMVGEEYPNATDMTAMTRSIADKYYGMVQALGGANADFTMQDFDFATMQKVTGKRNEGGEAAAGTAALMLWASAKFNDQKYLQAAEWSMDFLQRSSSNLFYEVLPILAPYLSARLNAQDGTHYDVSKYFSWLLSGSSTRSGWGMMDSSWGSYDVDGLVGSRSDGGGYAFAMNTFATPLAAATAKYDSRYANTIGQWMLNVNNAGRFFYADQMPAADQIYGSTYINDPAHVIAYEGLRNTGSGAVATSDIPAHGAAWGAGPNAVGLGLYGSSWVGMMGSTISPTNVSGVLRTDLDKLDLFGTNTYPTYLYYNPGSSAAKVDVALDGAHDLYDAVSDSVIARAASGTAKISVPAGSSVVLVEAPANGTLTRQGSTTLINNVAVGYNAMPSKNLALDGTATASSVAGGSHASSVNDGTDATTLAVPSSDAANVTIDLGHAQTISETVLKWGANQATAYTIQTSTDGATWADASSTTAGAGGTETVDFTPRTARYVRIELSKPRHDSAYTLNEFEVYQRNLALGTPVTVSSTQNDINVPSNLTDGSPSTRWESKTSDPQWFSVDLGSSQKLGTAVLSWETAAAKSYQIQTSDDGSTWKTVYSTTAGAGGTETISLDGASGRYVRMYGTQRLTKYAYSMFDFEVYPPSGDSSVITYAPTLTIGGTAASPGGTVSFTGTGYAPGETVAVSVAGGAAASVTADDDGSIGGSVVAPDTAGSYELQAVGAVSNVPAQAKLIVAAATGTGTGTATGPGAAPGSSGSAGHGSALASTGSDVSRALAAALLAVMLGLGLMLLRRVRVTRRSH